LKGFIKKEAAQANETASLGKHIAEKSNPSTLRGEFGRLVVQIPADVQDSIGHITVGAGIEPDAVAGGEGPSKHIQGASIEEYRPCLRDINIPGSDIQLTEDIHHIRVDGIAA